jgi:hypothetical protein
MSEPIKYKSLFDHLNEICEGKRDDYYDNLLDIEKKNFNQYIILIGLSMNKDCIDEISYISKYTGIIPDKQFYKVCCDLLPLGKKFSKWIKNVNSVNKELIAIVSLFYEIGKSDAIEYCDVMCNTELGILEITNILNKYGKTAKEIKEILK